MPLTRPKLGLALGGGAARGWAHIGILRALEAASIKPDIVCGTSIGAVVGAAYAAGELDRMETWARGLDRLAIARFFDVNLTSGGLIRGDKIVSFFREAVADRAIEDLAVPFGCVAADLVNGRPVWLREGSMIDAVRASIAVPGLLAPVQSGETWLVDGGVVDPVPVSLCRAMGAEIVIAVNINEDRMGRRLRQEGQRKRRRRKAAEAEEPPELRGSGGREFLDGLLEAVSERFQAGVGSWLGPLLKGPESKAPGYFDVVAESIYLMMDQITRARFASDPPDLLLAPAVGHVGLLEFHRAEETIAEGVSCVERRKETLRGLVPDHRGKE